MKFKTTQKAVRGNYNKIICVPYGSLQSLLNCESPVAYTERREGWAADIYDMGGGVAIVTGYAPFGNVRPPRELLERHETAAKKIRDYAFDCEKCKARLHGAIREFIKEVQCL